MMQILAKLAAAPIKRSIQNGVEEWEQIENTKNEFTPDQASRFAAEYERRRKKKRYAYLMLPMGLHYVYVDDWVRFVLFTGTLGGVMVWMFLDFVCMFHIVGKWNRKLSWQIIEEIWSSSDPVDAQAPVHEAPREQTVSRFAPDRNRFSGSRPQPPR